MSADALVAPKSTDVGAVRFAPFGRHTRYMLAAYLRHVLMVTSVLLAIALTIDLWPQFQIVATSSGSSPLHATWNIIRFSALRTPWLIAPFLSFATFLGVVWTEVVHTQSGERMLIWNSGRSPVQCLAPIALLGLVLGVGEFVLDAYLGPASMAVQMQERLGLDGQRLDRTRTGDSAWIALPDGLVTAQISYGPPPVLRNVTFFRRDPGGLLTEVDIADTARTDPGTGRWILYDGHSWATKKGTGDSSFGDSSGELMIPFTSRTVSLDIDSLWLTEFGIEPQYLPLDTLRRLTVSDRDPESLSRYRTRLQVLYGEMLLPGAMALLAASLCMLLMAYTTPASAVVGIVFVGYLVHFATKACLLLGQTGYMAPVLAGWLVPCSLLAVALVVLFVMVRRRVNAE
jgi:lipopolysaccharide export LptBFGC system permease protein LptF